MDKNSILQYKNQFDGITRHIESEDAKEQIEVWFARELQTILGYARWENFLVAIHRAVASCKSQQINVDDHFREVTKMVELGSGSKREIMDFMLAISLLRMATLKRKKWLLLRVILLCKPARQNL